MAKDFVKLLSNGGQMRDFFVASTNNATWVPGVFDELAGQLAEKYTYLPLSDEAEAGNVLQWLEGHPRVKGISMFRTPENQWQVSVAIDTTSNWTIIIRAELLDGLYTVYEQLKQRGIE
jgi:hypothetical protein